MYNFKHFFPLQTDGNATLYTKSEEFAYKVQQFMALAFVPAQDVIEVAEQLTSNDVQ